MFFSTHQVAKKLGLSVPSLYRYIELKKLPAPEAVKVGDRDVRTWTETDIEQARKFLPKIANGRKTRYSKLRKKQKPPVGVPEPHKSGKPKKKSRTTKPPKANG